MNGIRINQGRHGNNTERSILVDEDSVSIQVWQGAVYRVHNIDLREIYTKLTAELPACCNTCHIKLRTSESETCSDCKDKATAAA